MANHVEEISLSHMSEEMYIIILQHNTTIRFVSSATTASQDRSFNKFFLFFTSTKGYQITLEPVTKGQHVMEITLRKVLAISTTKV